MHLTKQNKEIVLGKSIAYFIFIHFALEHPASTTCIQMLIHTLVQCYPKNADGLIIYVQAKGVSLG